MATNINTDNTNKLMESSNNKILSAVSYVMKKFSRIKWKTVSFIIPIEPAPSHRPRLCGYRVYVPGAAKNQAFFQRKVLPTLNNLFITTPCKIKLDIYCKTPKSYPKAKTILAEAKYLRPWGATGDVDNFEKAVYDMMQPNEKRHNHGIMVNDSLIIEAHTNKYYSINPRYELSITYMDEETISDDLKKLMKLCEANEQTIEK